MKGMVTKREWHDAPHEKAALFPLMQSGIPDTKHSLGIKIVQKSVNNMAWTEANICEKYSPYCKSC